MASFIKKANGNGWQPADPITAEDLNRIEDGIVALEQQVDSLTGLDTSKITTIETDIQTLRYAVSALSSAIKNGQVSPTELNTVQNQLQSRIDSISDQLNNHMTANENSFSVYTQKMDAVETEIDEAHRNSVENDTLNKRFNDLESKTNSISTISNTINNLSDDVAAATSNISTLQTNVTSLQTEVQNGRGSEASLDARFDAIEAKLDVADEVDAIKAELDAAHRALGEANDVTLSQRFSAINTSLSNLSSADSTLTAALAENSTTKVISQALFNSLTAADVDANADYIVGPNDDNKYFYYKYINNAWQLISGGGGGTENASTAEIYANVTDIATPNANTDYFIGNDADGYIHYRYIEDAQNNLVLTMMLPKNLITDLSVNSDNGGLIAHTIGNDTNILRSFVALKNVNCVTTYDEDGVTPKMYTLSFTDTNGTNYTWDLAAGGGSGGSFYSVVFTNDSGAATYTLPNSVASGITIAAHLFAHQNNNPASINDATIQVRYKLSTSNVWLNGETITDIQNNTQYTFDVSNLLTNNAVTNIQLVATCSIENQEYIRTLNYTFTKVAMYIESINFDPSAVRSGSSLAFQYRCFGSNLAKTVYFKLDNTTTSLDVGTSHNTILTRTIDLTGLSRGYHTLQAWFVSGSNTSNVLNYYIMYNDGSVSNAPLVGAAAETTTLIDGEELIVNYSVFTSGQETTDKVTITTYTTNINEPYEVRTLSNVSNSTLHAYSTRNYPSSGTFNIRVVATHTVNGVDYTATANTSIAITEYKPDYNLEYEGVTSLLYDYSAYGRSNNDSDKQVYNYEFTNYNNDSVTFSGTSNGFNWATNGYTGDDALTISGGATHSVNVPLFSTSYNSVDLEMNSGIDNITTNGRTIEIDYEVNSASDLSATIMECMNAAGAGFKVTPQACYLVKSGANVNIDDSGLIHSEDAIAAAYLSTDMRTHLTFVIEPQSNNETTNHEYHQCVNIYVNGEFANSCPYDKTNDSFSSAAGLTIGSDTCIIKLYSIKMYNTGLTAPQVLNNYLMSATTKQAQNANFAANDILNDNGLVDYNKARNKYNCLLITGEISPYKKSDKTPSGVTFTKPTANGYTTEFDLVKKSSSTHTYISSNNVQGTSSQTYPIHNLKVYLVDAPDEYENAGETVTNIVTNPETGEDEYITNSKYKYSLRGSDGIGESTLCWKADYMSTDHANTYNANLANNLFSVPLPSQQENSKVQNTIYGVRCLLFQRDDVTSAPIFIADGCLNNDKGNNKAFGLEVSGDSGNDTLRQKWEFTNNSDALCFFRSDGLFAQATDESGEPTGDIKALSAFESTYPDQGDLKKATPSLQPNYNHLQILLTWVYQRANYWDASSTVVNGRTYTYNGTTYNNEKAYRKAIFLNEFEDHFILNHVLTYHLFSEFIALCDNRAKNMFLRCDNVREEVVYKLNDNTPIFEGNSNPNADYMKELTADGEGQKFAHANDIDWAHSTFAKWAPVLYDLDSCYGVENVGKITISYDADWDYKYENSPQFSGIDSRLWLMVEDAFADQLNTLAGQLYPQTNGLSYDTINTQQIIANQNATCPALVNQDMQLKFDQFWADGFVDYSLSGNPHVFRNYKYLQRGTRTSQKRSFMRKRANYLSSKYGTSNLMQDQIRFRSSVEIPQSNSGITVTTNQTLYPCITYGDNKPVVRSANKIAAGDSVTIFATDKVGNTDTIHIGGASALTDIGDLSKWRPYDMDVAGGINLKKLIIGSASINNTSTNKIDNLAACSLLEEIDVTNCTKLEGLSLTGNGLIKRVYAEGTNISPVLPNGGVLEELRLGENAQTIMLLNQSRFTTFSYQNSNTNNYANVTRVWVENTPNVPVIDIVTKAFYHISNGLRLVGLNETLTDMTFLELLASSYAKGKYLNSEGAFNENNNSYPYIEGTVTVSAIRQTLYDTLHDLYPNLTIIASSYIQDHQIIYQDYDGTELLRLAAVEGETIPDPVSALDDTGKPYLAEPTRASDAAASYTFGRHTSGNYVVYSGWKRLMQDGTYATNNWTMPDMNVTLVAVYTETPMTYSIQWKTADGSLIKTFSPITYGTNLATSGISHPAIGESGLTLANFYRYQASNGKYKLLTGWDTPLSGNVTGDIVITGIYEENEHIFTTSSTLTDLSTLNAADLYALSNASSSIKNRLLPNLINSTYFNMTLGNDFNYESIESYDLIKQVSASNDSLTFTGTNKQVLTALAPLINNEAFTVAIDIKPLQRADVTNGDEYVLFSCYQESGGSIGGLRISLCKDNSIRVYWGDQYVIIDNCSMDDTTNTWVSYRTMVVIAHDADSAALRVYYGNPGPATNIIQENIVSTTLTYNSPVTVTNPIILGGVNTSKSASILTNGAGILYWGKYWNASLSAEDCLSLASWPHKTVRCTLIGYNNGVNAAANDTAQIIHDDNVQLSFAIAEPISDRFYLASSMYSASNNVYGWGTSNLRIFCQNRLFNSLPLKYRALLKATSIISLQRTVTGNNYTNSRVEVEGNYFYLPSYGELQTTNTYSSSTYNGEVTHPWGWFDIDNVPTVYIKNASGALSTTQTNGESTSLLVNINPLRLKFLNYILTSTSRIFYFDSDPWRITAYVLASGGTTNIQIGDIWCYYNSNEAGNSINNYYIFVSAEDILAGLPIKYTCLDNNGEIIGGWAEALPWLTRSYKSGINVSNSSNVHSFINISPTGGGITTIPQNPTAYALCPEFSI